MTSRKCRQLAALLILHSAFRIAHSASAAPPATQPAPARIITLAPNAAEIICDLGAADRLVAVDRYTVHPPTIAHLPRVGGLHDPDLEAILTLKPDLIILRGRSDTVEKLAQAKGVRLYRDPTESLADIERTVREIGELLRLPGRAHEVVERMRGELEAVEKSVAGRPRPRVLMTHRGPDQLSNIYTVAKGSYLDDLVRLAGGENIFAELDAPYPLISVEEIVARRPEVIVESLFGAKVTDELRAQCVNQWRAAGNIPAVRNGRVHLLSSDYATIPSPRAAKLAADLARLFHPESASRPTALEGRSMGSRGGKPPETATEARRALEGRNNGLVGNRCIAPPGLRAMGNSGSGGLRPRLPYAAPPGLAGMEPGS